MPEQIEITADKIVNLFPRTTRSHAARIAAYIDLRRQGLDPFEAIIELGLGIEQNPSRYERWLTSVFEALGLPPLPVRTPAPKLDTFSLSDRGL